MKDAREGGIRVTVVPPEGRHYAYELPVPYHGLPDLADPDQPGARRLKAKWEPHT
jgi:hypothetical protein